MIKNNGKGSFSEVEKRNQTIAHSFLFCAKMKEFVSVSYTHLTLPTNSRV